MAPNRGLLRQAFFMARTSPNRPNRQSQPEQTTRMSSPSSVVQRELFAWLDQALSRPLPPNTVAFHVNLYEGMDSVHLQLVGTDSFTPGEQPERDYWPGDETFSTGEDVFHVPFSVAGANWRDWQATCLSLLQTYLNDGEKANVIRASQGLGMGFVDGDMNLLWPACER